MAPKRVKNSPLVGLRRSLAGYSRATGIIGETPLVRAEKLMQAVNDISPDRRMKTKLEYTRECKGPAQ